MAQSETSNTWETFTNFDEIKDSKEKEKETADFDPQIIPGYWGSERPYFAHEVLNQIDSIQIGTRVQQSPTDYYYPIYSFNTKIRVQTPIMQIMFALQSYRNPGNNDLKYSLHLSLKQTDPATVCFRNMLEKIDEVAKSNISLPPETYYSCIRFNHANPTLPPVMRIKIQNSIPDCLAFDLYDPQWGETIHPTIRYATECLKHKSNVVCILEINPIWIAGNKFGVSYKLIQLQIMDVNSGPQFRCFESL